MYTVGKLAKMFNLSRSTLLYYDKIGLLTPSGRSDKNYRLYTESDLEKLNDIVHHREAGIPLDDIGKLMDIEASSIAEILSRRLRAIQEEVKLLKKQESMILSVLINKVRLENNNEYDKKSWTHYLLDSGYSEADLINWHHDFEKTNKDEHRSFLQSLGMSEEEIKALVSRIE